MQEEFERQIDEIVKNFNPNPVPPASWTPERLRLTFAFATDVATWMSVRLAAIDFLNRLGTQTEKGTETLTMGKALYSFINGLETIFDKMGMEGPPGGWDTLQQKEDGDGT